MLTLQEAKNLVKGDVLVCRVPQTQEPNSPMREFEAKVVHANGLQGYPACVLVRYEFAGGWGVFSETQLQFWSRKKPSFVLVEAWRLKVGEILCWDGCDNHEIAEIHFQRTTVELVLRCGDSMTVPRDEKIAVQVVG